MKYVCPICKKEFPREIDVIIEHTDIHVVDIIKKSHPHWVDKDGTCKKCYEWYKKQMKP